MIMGCHTNYERESHFIAPIVAQVAKPARLPAGVAPSGWFANLRYVAARNTSCLFSSVSSVCSAGNNHP
jgi:hypothetical protein